MAVEDTMCTLVPYFTVQDGKLDEFKAIGEQMVEATKTESESLFYGFTFNGHRALCREGYTGAAGVLAHLKNIDALLKQALAISSLDVFEIHGPAPEVDQLREPLKGLNPVFFVLESGFRR